MNANELAREIAVKFAYWAGLSTAKAHTWLSTPEAKSLIAQLSGVGGMKWVLFTEILPEAGVEVLFDGEEKCPVYGRLKYNGKHPSILLLDSSGEEDYVNIDDYYRWLSESPIPSGEQDGGWISVGERYITQMETGGRINLYFKENNVYLGYCYKEVDGYYVFIFKDDMTGAWSDYALKAIAGTLTELNKDWDEEVKTLKP